ncbi:Protein of unknown function [Actinokineospora alba]|uniref:DUF3558 domain-containing protein n=2 Tax=Actinokineospora alba TaxID=504798 RepID=A0A1H0KIS0_9PSEU|nr:DUF3558 family protein [Actinokineospora alba]TDP67883.1 uncharacterized protein DUF3558 [Actinokineospora alba]SDH88150.1 Protein of unknown function [Actinokineospora alba]SDO55884.1 Protein of unknown function [Actinokineospora alba]
MAGIRQGMLFFTAIALTGCSSPPAPTPASPTKLDVPSVAKPLDTKSFTDDPCAMLTAEDRTQLGLPTAEKNDELGRAACDLHAEAAGQKPLEYLRVQIMTTRGLKGVTAQCGTSEAARCVGWVVDSVEGYPVIRANGELEAKYGACKEFLGISEQAVILINDVRTGSASAPDCSRADRTAAMVIRTLTP